MKKTQKLINSPYLLFILGFLVVISIGTITLMTPLVSLNGNWTPLLTALFTATSATCVNGLSLVDIGTYFNAIGHVVIMLLIQVGGIGIMAFAAIFIQLFKGRLSLQSKLNLHENYNSKGIGDGIKTIKAIFLISLISEFIGMLFLSLVFVPEHGLSKGLFYSLFHSISAFNNAGFDLNGNFSSLTNYSGNLIVNVTIILLILTGSLGFLTILDIIQKKKFNKFNLTTKIVLSTTGVLLVFGFVSFFVLEYNNPDTFARLSLYEKILASLFLSVTPKSAGFSTIDPSGLSIASVLIVILFMYIGASPTSTGGGLKTTTVIIPLLSVFSILKGKEDIEVFERRIPSSLVSKTVAIMCIVFILTIGSTIALSITENADLMTILFEVASAINTTGLSLGFTPNLSITGRFIIIVLMFVGRIGPLTLVMSMSLKSKRDAKFKYVEEKILIG